MGSRRVFSGIQPTADSFHLGNYLGAVRQWVDLQETRDAIYCVVDLHAITVPYDPAALRRRTRVAAAQLIAAGLDPERCILFVQSQAPEHAELNWVLGCITGFGEANRMTQFKDKSARGGADQASVGLFTYPILQAADILLYQADEVPVGEDQRQHLELSRTLAQRFNHRFGETFTVPAPYILPTVAKITDLQDPASKMSKSSSSPQGIIDLLDEPDAIRRKINRAVTDADSVVRADEVAKPGVTNLLRIYSALSGQTFEEISAAYGDSGYGKFKKDLGELVVGTFAPIRERTAKILGDPAALDAAFEQAITDGCEGLMCKSVGPASVYQAGNRGWQWIKLKRDYRTELSDTVDLVIVGAFAGRGRRAGTYGAVLLAAYDPDAELYRTVTKCGTGFSDADLASLPERLAPLARAEKPARVDARQQPDFWFEPGVVIEVLSAELTLSPHYSAGWGVIKEDAGLAMRFPRFTGRWRDDKDATDATTTGELVDLFRTAQRSPVTS